MQIQIMMYNGKQKRFHQTNGSNRNMTAIAKKIEEEIQHLPLEDMLALHEQLLVSIHEREEARSLDPAFRNDIQRRIDEIDSGKVQGVDALEALKKM